MTSHRPTTPYLIAAALGSLALGGIAHAAQTTASPPPPAAAADGKAMGARMMARIDTDGDGRISRAEHDALSARRFQRMDTNGDGYIDQAEQAAMPRPGRHRRPGAPAPAPSPAAQTPKGG